MSRRGRLTVLAAMCAALLASAVVASAPAGAAPKPKWVPAPWRQIARGQRPKLLVIDVPESTRNRHSICFDHYRARAVKQTRRLITILLLRRVPRLPHGVACPAVAIRGPFLVPVRLKAPYRGQELIDATTGLRHRLIPRSALF